MKTLPSCLCILGFATASLGGAGTVLLDNIGAEDGSNLFGGYGGANQIFEAAFSAYNIGVASLLLIGGWLSERYGHKRIFLIGVSIFLAGSVLAGIAASSEMLIAARVVQAVGGALQSPAGLALILAAAPPARRSARQPTEPAPPLGAEGSAVQPTRSASPGDLGCAPGRPVGCRS